MPVLYLLLLLLSVQSWAVTEQYDKQFKAASNKFLPYWEWQWLKAQCYQESLLDPKAVSHVGAKGLCQFMPATCNEVFTMLGFKCEPYNAEKSIIASAFYMSRLRKIWRARRSEDDRRKWAQCSYNFGAGNCIKAQSRCGNHSSFEKVIGCLPEETKTYVERIKLYFQKFSCD